MPNWDDSGEKWQRFLDILREKNMNPDDIIQLKPIVTHTTAASRLRALAKLQSAGITVAEIVKMGVHKTLAYKAREHK